MSRFRGLVLALLVLIGATPVLAQVQTGSILVRLNDEQGGGMPGVTITITSQALVSGSSTGVSDAGGAYRFPSLPPGTYTVKTELSGFQTVIRENVAVLVGQTTPIDLAMKVATIAETVTVTGASPVIDTTSATVAVNLSEELLQNTPGGRDIWGLVEYKVPSLLITRPDVGGTSGGLQGTYSARGTGSAQNSQYLNGINVGDPSAIGAAGYYYDYDAFDDIQVSTGAHDITVPTSGVFLNMVTKSGGDKWAGSATATWLGDATQGQNIDDDLLRYGFRPDTNSVDYTSDVSITFGGPLIARKLRLFGSFRDWRVHVNVPAAFSENVLDKTDMRSGLLNATYQLNDRHRLTAFWSKQTYKKPNRFLTNPTTLLELASTSNEDDVFDVYQGLWNGVITPKFFIDARVGLNKIKFPTYQNGSDQTLLDNATSIRTRNAQTDVERLRDRYQFNATGNYYIDQLAGGRHELKFGFDHAHAPVRVTTNRFDDLELTWNSAQNLAQNVTLFATPFFTRTAVDVTALYVQDSYSIKRLTVTGGVRWERLEAYLPAQESPATPWAALGIGGFPAAPRSFTEQRDVILWHTAGPRISAAYDVTGDGRTALKGAVGRYYYMISTDGTPLGNVNPNANYQEQYAWNDRNRDLRFQLDEQSGTPVVTSGITTSIDPNFERPFTDEYTLGVDRELLPALRFSAVFTYRREDQPMATYNPNFPFATTLTSRADAGRDGVSGTADDTTFQFYDRLTAGNPVVVTNDPGALQTYKGLELTATRRMTDRWMMIAGYTYSQTRVKGLSVNVDPNRVLNTDGPLTGQAQIQAANANSQLGDRPHQFKLTGNYILPLYDLEIGGNFSTTSGIPVTRQINTALTVGGTTTVNVEPAGSARLDTRVYMDLRLARTFRFGSRSLLAAVDINNVTNTNIAWDARSLSGTLGFRQAGDPGAALNTLPQFLSPAAVYGPRNVRFNASLRF